MRHSTGAAQNGSGDCQTDCADNLRKARKSQVSPQPSKRSRSTEKALLFVTFSPGVAGIFDEYLVLVIAINRLQISGQGKLKQDERV
jgi:hypothetical protein